MNLRKTWLHDTIPQTLYSGRCGVINSPYFAYALAQARSDVFFSLLFGGRVVYSAAALLDSPIAIRVLGELFSHDDFSRIVERYSWFPLYLNTDNPHSWNSAREYLVARWRNLQIKMYLFRENDETFSIDIHSDESISDIRKHAAKRLENKDWEGLGLLYRPFRADFSTTSADLARPSSAIMNDNFQLYLKSILDYLENPGCFANMDAFTYTNVISSFSPFAAVVARTQKLTFDEIENYSREELSVLNNEFKALAGDSPLMNSFHMYGPAVYGHYFLLVNSWIEAEWHMSRHTAYRSSVCLLSSNWAERNVFDFDKRSLVHYAYDTYVDDSLRLTQEQFGDLDWSVLLSVVSDSRWRSIVSDIHEATNAHELTSASDAMINILSNKISNFHFDSEGGRLKILSKKISPLVDYSANAALCLTIVDTVMPAFFGAPGLVQQISDHIMQPHISSEGMRTALSVGAAVPRIHKVLRIPGVRWAYRRYKNLHLRTSVVSSNYIP